MAVAGRGGGVVDELELDFDDDDDVLDSTRTVSLGSCDSSSGSSSSTYMGAASGVVDRSRIASLSSDMCSQAHAQVSQSAIRLTTCESESPLKFRKGVWQDP